MKAWRSLTVALWVSFTLSVWGDYQNFTVGEEEGWTPKPSVSYTKWASDKNFTLGDFLIFNFAKPAYDVIRTYNETVYKSCDYMTSNGDFEVWGEPGTTEVSAIPLVETGPNYFFCGVNNSKLCKEGMKFRINVSVGDGLPTSLATPPPSSSNGTSISQPSNANGDGGSNNKNDDDNGAFYIYPRIVLVVLSAFIPSILIVGLF